MTLLNVSFGIYAFLPQGWIFMSVIILIECLALSYLLTKKWSNTKIYGAVVVSNIVSGIIGIAASLALNGGWWLVVWFPWVSENEVSGDQGIKWFTILYLIAFILTLIIEGVINFLLLRKTHPKQVVNYTFWINVMSYAFGSIVMYSYSF